MTVRWAEWEGVWWGEEGDYEFRVSIVTHDHRVVRAVGRHRWGAGKQTLVGLNLARLGRGSFVVVHPARYNVYSTALQTVYSRSVQLILGFLYTYYVLYCLRPTYVVMADALTDSD